MLDYERKDFAKLLKRGALEGRRWMRSTDSEAVRIYDRNLEGVPVTVDLYGKYAKIVDYAPGALDESTKAQVIDLVNRMAYVELGRIIYQVRRKREGLEQHTLMSDEKVELVVKEHGLEFLVDLTSHIDTGLFLDHAITREYVRSISEGLRVLNLFSYTGSFSVYAAAGKAESVTSVDMSNTYCAIAERNLAANGFIDKSRFPVVVSDALAFIDKAVAEGAQYDLVVFDPPSFSNSHRMARPFDVKKDYLAWMSKLSRIMSDHAILIFSCNSSTFALDKSTLKRSFRITGITEQMAPVGFSRSKGGMSRTWLMEKLDLFEWREDHSREYGTGRSKVKTVDDQDFEHLVSSIDSEEAQAGGDRPSRRDDRRGRSEGRPSYRDDRRPSWREGTMADPPPTGETDAGGPATGMSEEDATRTEAPMTEATGVPPTGAMTGEAVMKAVLHTGTTDDLPGVGATREGTRADPPKAGDLMAPVRDVPPGPATMAAHLIATGLQEMTGDHIRTGMAGAVPRAIPTTRHAVPGSPSGPTAMTA